MAEHWETGKLTVVRWLEEPSVTCHFEGCTVAQILDREEPIDLDVHWVDRILVFAGMRESGSLDRPFQHCGAYRQSQGSRFQQDDLLLVDLGSSSSRIIEYHP